MSDVVDTFNFTLARALGKTLQEILDLPDDEYMLWRSFYKVEAAMNGPWKSYKAGD